MSNPTILHKVVDPILNIMLVLSMKALMPVRKRGVFGTSDKPIYLNKGDNVPHWLQMRSPWLKLHITCDCETYYDPKEESQVVRPLFKIADYVMEVNVRLNHPLFADGHIVGAPTLINITPRPKQSSKIKNHGCSCDVYWDGF